MIFSGIVGRVAGVDHSGVFRERGCPPVFTVTVALHSRLVVARVVDEDELIDRWTLVGDELGEVAGKRGATRLGFAILLKFYSCHGRFPLGRAEVPDEVIAYVARQVEVSAADLGFYEWSGRTFEYHRARLRHLVGLRADPRRLAARPRPRSRAHRGLQTRLTRSRPAPVVAWRRREAGLAGGLGHHLS